MKEEVAGMALTKKKYASNKKYNDKTYELLGFRSRKEERLDELIVLGAEKTNQTKSMYMKNAIKSQLVRDGITIDMLPSDSKYVPVTEAARPKQYLIYMVTEWMIDNPEDFQAYIDKTGLFFEEYVTCFQTLKAAKDYIKNKYKRKAHPEQWCYTIYGRSFEAKNKRDAYDLYRQMVQDALKLETDSLNNATDDDSIILEFISILEEQKKPEYVEVLNYEIAKEDMITN